MSHRTRVRDNVFVERPGRTVKYVEASLGSRRSQVYPCSGLKAYFRSFDVLRPL